MASSSPETSRTKRVEGNAYFPPESLRREYFTESATKSVCPWKGVARYCAVTVEGTREETPARRA